MKKDEITTHIKNIFGIVKEYFRCSIIDGLIVGAANYLFMWYMEMPWKIGISILMGITNLVPNIGPVVGAILGGVVIAFYDIKQALWFLVFTVILQAIDGLVIKPQLFGKSFGISGVLMLITMIVGGALFGVAGLVLAAPAVAIIRYIINVINTSRACRKS